MISYFTNKMADIWEGWEKFWFSPQNPATLGLMRWFVGGMILYTHFVWGIQLDAFFSSKSWVSRDLYNYLEPDSAAMSFWWYVPDAYLRLVHTVCLVALFFFMIGFLTPVTSLLAVVITVSNSNRAWLSNYGLDQILSLLALYLCIGGAGATLSVDRLIKTWRDGSLKQEGFRALFPNTSQTVRANFGTRLIQVHFCVIYFFAGISKLQGEEWWNGNAVWLAFSNKEYQSIDMTWLAGYQWVTQLATHITVLWELSFCYLIWQKHFRWLMLFWGASMHLGIGFCMGMPTFGLIMIYGYSSFVKPEETTTLLIVCSNIIRKTIFREKISWYHGAIEPSTTIAHATQGNNGNAVLTHHQKMAIQSVNDLKANEVEHELNTGESSPAFGDSSTYDQHTLLKEPCEKAFSILMLDSANKFGGLRKYLRMKKLQVAKANLWRDFEDALENSNPGILIVALERVTSAELPEIRLRLTYLYEQGYKVIVLIANRQFSHFDGSLVDQSLSVYRLPCSMEDIFTEITRSDVAKLHYQQKIEAASLRKHKEPNGSSSVMKQNGTSTLGRSVSSKKNTDYDFNNLHEEMINMEDDDQMDIKQPDVISSNSNDQ